MEYRDRHKQLQSDQLVNNLANYIFKYSNVASGEKDHIKYFEDWEKDIKTEENNSIVIDVNLITQKLKHHFEALNPKKQDKDDKQTAAQGTAQDKQN